MSLGTNYEMVLSEVKARSSIDCARLCMDDISCQAARMHVPTRMCTLSGQADDRMAHSDYNYIVKRNKSELYIIVIVSIFIAINITKVLDIIILHVIIITIVVVIITASTILLNTLSLSLSLSNQHQKYCKMN